MGSSPVGGTTFQWSTMQDQDTHTGEPEQIEVTEDEKLMAILAYVPILCLIPFLSTQRTAYVTEHVRLGLALFVIEIIAIVLRFAQFIWDMVIVLCVIAALAGILHVVRGRTFRIPYLSDLFSRRIG